MHYNGKTLNSVVILVLVNLALGGCGGSSGSGEAVSMAPLARLGQQLYFDENLSEPRGQSCASCHLPSAGFADPDAHFPVSEGVVAGRFGARNAPTASYAAFTPPFRFVLDGAAGHYEGGQFWDGRAADLESQAQGPFLNSLEMNLPNKEAVITRVRNAVYAGEFNAIFGVGALDDVDLAFEQLAGAIAAFERDAFFAPFSSKFDAVRAGTAVFSPAEANGQRLFNGRANCNRCHSSRRNEEQVFTNFEYANLGVPANPVNPFLQLPADLNPDGVTFVDLGLGGALAETAQNGKFKTPTLRNVALTAPYMHNGVFATLEQVIEFYNRRDLDGDVAEVGQNVENAGNIGNLGLSPAEVQDLVAFLTTLSDGFQ